MRAARLRLLPPFLLAAVLFPLAACTTPTPSAPAQKPPMAPPDLTAPYAAAAVHGTSVYRLDPGASKVLVLVGKTGPLAGAGHVHVIVVSKLRGFALAAPNHGGRADLVFPVRALAVDPPAARSALGGEYARVKMTAEQRAGTHKNMLGSAVLDAAHYRWTALAIHASVAAGKPTADIRLRGVTRGLRVPGRYRVTPKRIEASGSLALRQSDFGIKPFSAFLGALRVKDKIEIRYHLLFRRWCPAQAHSTCSTPP